jgi:Na+-driven multidrug efflux pump
MASNIMIGQAMGANDQALAKRVIGTSTAFFIIVSLTVGFVGATLTPYILNAMGTPVDAKRDAIAYLRVIFSAMPFMYFFSYVMMAQRGTGDSRTPFYFALLAVGMDVVLNPLLIMGVRTVPEDGDRRLGRLHPDLPDRYARGDDRAPLPQGLDPGAAAR